METVHCGDDIREDEIKIGIVNRARSRRGPSNLELLAIHGGDVSLLADGEGVGHSLSGSFGGDNKVAAILLDLGNGLDVFGHLDDIFWQFW